MGGARGPATWAVADARIERSASSGDERGHGGARPRRKHPGERSALRKQRARPPRFEGDEVRCRLALLATEGANVSLRQVHPTPLVVLRHILEVLGHLQRRTDAVRQRNPLDRGGSEHVQDELADRSRGELAVAQQLGEGLVPAYRMAAPVELALA